MHLPLRRADLDGHRHLDARGNHLRVLHLRVLHLEHPVRRRRGNRRRLRRHPDVRPVRRRDDPGDLLREPDEPIE